MHDRFPHLATVADRHSVSRLELAMAAVPYMEDDDRNRDRYPPRVRWAGVLHGWVFRRAWDHWVAEGGPRGLSKEDAGRLHATHGLVVRAGGIARAPHPSEVFGGGRATRYHVDSLAGLAALAAMIRLALARGLRPEQRKQSRSDLLARYVYLAAEIRTVFDQAREWNAAHPDDPIDPDSDGELARCLVTLEEGRRSLEARR